MSRKSRERDDAVLRSLVLPQPGERGRTHVTVLRELEEVRLDDDLRLRPEPDMGIDLRDLGERTFLLPQRDEPFEQRPSQLFGEAGSDTADVEQRALEVRPQDQRPKRVFALAFAGRDPTDDAVQRRLLLDLDPVFAPLADLVPGLLVLRDDALEASGDDHVVIVDPAALDVVAEDDPIVDVDEIGQQRLPLHLREAHHGLLADVQDVEDDVRRREGLREVLDVDLSARPFSLLELLEARERAVHDDDLAVQDRVFPSMDLQVRIAALDVVEPPVLEAVTVPHERESPRAVPLQLEDMVLRVKRRLAALRKHRLDDVEVGVEGRHPLSWLSRPGGCACTPPRGPGSASTRISSPWASPCPPPLPGSRP